MDLSIAEVFLLAWAIFATVVAGYSWSRLKFYFMHGRAVSVLLAEVVNGDVKPYTRADGFTVVENDDLKMSFKKKED